MEKKRRRDKERELGAGARLEGERHRRGLTAGGALRETATMETVTMETVTMETVPQVDGP